MIWKIVAGIIGGLLVASLAGNVVTLAFGRDRAAGTVVFLVLWALAIVGALKSPQAAKAWRWILVTSASLSFILPLAALIRTVETKQGAAAAVGGLVATGFFGVVFFLLGLAFLVIGLLVGRDKQIVIIKEEKDKT